MPTADSAKSRRKRCLNDNKLFTPARNVPDQKFCCDACRKEFHRHGSAFGPMKLGLYAAIDKKYVRLRKEFLAEMRDQSRRIDRVERMIDPLRQEYERHTHDFLGDVGSFDYETTIPKQVARRPPTLDRS